MVFVVSGGVGGGGWVGGVFFIQSSPKDAVPARIQHREWMMQSRLASRLSRCVLLHPVTDSFWRICPGLFVVPFRAIELKGY